MIRCSQPPGLHRVPTTISWLWGWNESTGGTPVPSAGFSSRHSRGAGELPNYNPHSFRHTLAVLGEKICRTPEEWKAYSQNFGHFSPMTTFNSYGPVAPHRQAEILNALVDVKPTDPNAPAQIVKLDDDQVRLILNQLARAKVEEDA
jgi:integrase